MTSNLHRAIPVLQITDAERSCAFYCDQLGFKKDWEHQFEPGFPRFVSVTRGNITLFLTEHPESAAGALIYLVVDDASALAHEFKANNAVLEQEPLSQPWGMREFQIKDPDGNRLRFGQDTDASNG